MHGNTDISDSRAAVLNWSSCLAKKRNTSLQQPSYFNRNANES